MFYNDPETGERKPYVDLLLLHNAGTLPGLTHLPDWLQHDLIEKDPQLIRSYLRGPANVSLRRKLSARIIVRVQAELDVVLTCQNQNEEQRNVETKRLYAMRWAIDQMQAVLTSKIIQKSFSRKEYQDLNNRHDALFKEREMFVRDRPNWARQIGMDRWDAQRLERVLFDERQAIERMEAGVSEPEL